jgi:hypothetical protein
MRQVDFQFTNRDLQITNRLGMASVAVDSVPALSGSAGAQTAPGLAPCFLALSTWACTCSLVLRSGASSFAASRIERSHAQRIRGLDLTVSAPRA